MNADSTTLYYAAFAAVVGSLDFDQMQQHMQALSIYRG
jgi:hypothetical protein